MRFNARIVEADQAPVDETGELELPDDLLQLATRLGDDSKALAARYPAGGFDEAPCDIVGKAAEAACTSDKADRSDAPGNHVLRRLALAATSLAPLLILAAGAVYIWQLQLARDVPREAANRADSVVEREVFEPQAVASSPVDNGEYELAPASLSAPHMPLLHSEFPSAVFLNEVTAPQMEGLVDIWEEGAPPESDLSI